MRLQSLPPLAADRLSAGWLIQPPPAPPFASPSPPSSNTSLRFANGTQLVVMLASPDGQHVTACGLDLREALRRVALGVERLALEVGEFNDVAIDEGECSDAGAREVVGGDASERAHPDQERVRVAQAALAVFPDEGEELLAVVASGAGVLSVSSVRMQGLKVLGGSAPGTRPQAAK